MDTFFLKGRDLAPVSAVDDVDLGVTVDVAHETDASRAQDAPLAVQHERRPEVDVPLDTFAIENAPGELHAALIGPERVREILQRALAAFVADRTIERVVDQQKLEHAGARRHHIVGPGLHDHALGADR